MKFENVRVFNFEGAIRGMRNPKNSWNKSDSFFGLVNVEDTEVDYGIVEKWMKKKHPEVDLCDYVYDDKELNKEFDILDKWLIKNGTLKKDNDELISYVEVAFIGPDDMRLAQQLIKAGPEHRKFMRQIFVSVDITAPLYWWKEFDTYKVGTVANSCSTMHKIHAKEFTLEDFSCEHLITPETAPGEYDWTGEYYDVPIVCLKYTIDTLNIYRKKYLETKDKRYWWQMIQLLPSSYNQKRTVTMSYENLFAICSKGQRRFHKLNEWSGQDNQDSENFISFARSLPYSQELLFIDETIPEEVTISKETYEILLDSNRKLNALECGGVDNWEGYDYSLSEFYKNRLEDDE